MVTLTCPGCSGKVRAFGKPSIMGCNRCNVVWKKDRRGNYQRVVRGAYQRIRSVWSDPHDTQITAESGEPNSGYGVGFGSSTFEAPTFALPPGEQVRTNVQWNPARAKRKVTPIRNAFLNRGCNSCKKIARTLHTNPAEAGGGEPNVYEGMIRNLPTLPYDESELSGGIRNGVPAKIPSTTGYVPGFTYDETYNDARGGYGNERPLNIPPIISGADSGTGYGGELIYADSQHGTGLSISQGLPKNRPPIVSGDIQARRRGRKATRKFDRRFNFDGGTFLGGALVGIIGTALVATATGRALTGYAARKTSGAIQSRLK